MNPGRFSERYAERVGSLARTDLHHLYEAWAVPGTPFAVGLDAENRVVFSGVVNTLDQLETVSEAVSNSTFDNVDSTHDLRGTVPPSPGERNVGATK